MPKYFTMRLINLTIQAADTEYFVFLSRLGA